MHSPMSSAGLYRFHPCKRTSSHLKSQRRLKEALQELKHHVRGRNREDLESVINNGGRIDSQIQHREREREKGGVIEWLWMLESSVR